MFDPRWPEYPPLHTQHGGWYIREQTPEEKAKTKAEARRAYIRQHAPAIMAAMAMNPIRWPDDIRKAAIQQAGLLYDETEAPTDG